MGILALILSIIVIIGAIVIGFMLADKAFGQTAPAATPPPATTPPPPPVIPTPTIAPTPTAPTPNFQYLPQKAYVQPYAPEVGIPTNTQPLTAIPQVIPVQQSTTGGTDTNTVMGIIGAISGLAGVGYSKIVGNKTNKVENLTKDTLGATAETKFDVKELARVLFEFNQDKATQLNDAPSIKLDNLEKKATDTADKAAKA